MKKLLITVSAVFILLFGSLQLYVYLSRPIPLDELSVKVANLPALRLEGLDGSPYMLPQHESLVLIYFNSTCEHCQLQVSAIWENMNLFSSTQLVLMSSQSREEIVEFAEALNVAAHANVHMALITHAQLAETFGTLSLPQTFVYSGEGKLNAVFAGETSPQTIAESLR